MASLDSTNWSSACDSIAEFYEGLGVPARKTVGPFGGKSFTWYVTDGGQPFQVRCASQVNTLGFGVLRVESRMASDLSVERWFQRGAIVNHETSKINLKRPLGLSEHEIRLPTPEETKKK